MVSGNNKRDIFRTKDSAKEGVVTLLRRDISNLNQVIQFDIESPDGDSGKISLFNKTVRIFHRFQGYHLHINSDWFDGQISKPKVKGRGIYKGESGEFEYYALAIEPKKDDPFPHYLLINYKKLINWVLEFEAPLGRDWKESTTWMANVKVFDDGTGYFKWGDEPNNEFGRQSRKIKLDNLEDIVQENILPFDKNEEKKRKYGKLGESERHKNLKNYIARNPEIIGVDNNSIARIERVFTSGDRADIVFETSYNKKLTQITAVEIELEGSANLLTGIYQAIKYAILCCAESDQDLEFGFNKKVRSVLIAHNTDYPEIKQIAKRYGVELLSIPESEVERYFSHN